MGIVGGEGSDLLLVKSVWKIELFISRMLTIPTTMDIAIPVKSVLLFDLLFLTCRAVLLTVGSSWLLTSNSEVSTDLQLCSGPFRLLAFDMMMI